MALPHTIVELLNHAKLSSKDREQYEQRVYAILHKIYEKGREVGYDDGYARGMEESFDALESGEVSESLALI